MELIKFLMNAVKSRSALTPLMIYLLEAHFGFAREKFLSIIKYTKIPINDDDDT